MSRKKATPKNGGIDPDSQFARILSKWLSWKRSAPERTQKQASEKLLRLIFESMPQSADSDIDAAHRALMAGLLFESDRGFILVAASLIDYRLELLFESVFQSRSTATAKEIAKLLNAPYALLQNTAAKIHLAFALGYIDRSLSAALGALQSLRSNMAAHSDTIINLEGKQIRYIANHLPEEGKKSFFDRSNSAQWAVAIQRARPEISDEKIDFARLIIVLLMYLAHSQSVSCNQSDMPTQ